MDQPKSATATRRPAWLCAGKRCFRLVDQDYASDQKTQQPKHDGEEETAAAPTSFLAELHATHESEREVIAGSEEEDDLMIQLPSATAIPEAVWRTLFPAPAIAVSELPALYQTCLQLGLPLGRIQPQLLQAWKTLSTPNDVYHWCRTYAIHCMTLPVAERKPKFMTMDEFRQAQHRTNHHVKTGSPLKHTPEPDAPPFDGVRWVALVRRLTAAEGAAFLDALHALFEGDVSSECLAVPVVYKLAADDLREQTSHTNACPQMLDVFRFQGKHASISADLDFPHGCELFDKDAAVAAVTTVPQLCTREEFCERFERTTHGFCQHPAIAALLEEQILMPCAGMVTHCLESADPPPPGKDVDLFVHLEGGGGGTDDEEKKRTPQEVLDLITAAFDAWAAERFPGKRAYWAYSSTCCIELAIDDVECTYQFVFCADTTSLAQILFLFDASNKMVSYDGHTVRAPYDGLQTWLTGRAYYWPRRGAESQIKGTRIRKLLASGFQVFVPDAHRLRWHPHKKEIQEALADTKECEKMEPPLPAAGDLWQMPTAKTVLPRATNSLATNLASRPWSFSPMSWRYCVNRAWESMCFHVVAHPVV